MRAAGTVTRVRRHVNEFGSVFVSINLDHRSRFRFLWSGEQLPVKGQRVVITGAAVIGSRAVNVAGVRITPV